MSPCSFRNFTAVFLKTGMILSASAVLCSQRLLTNMQPSILDTSVEFTKADVDQGQTYPSTSLFTFPCVRLTANCLFINLSSFSISIHITTFIFIVK